MDALLVIVGAGFAIALIIWGIKYEFTHTKWK